MADPDLTVNVPIGSGGIGGGGIGAAITEQLGNTIKNMDIAETLRKMVSAMGDDEESLELRGKLENIIQKYSTLSDEDKAAFANQVKDGITSRLGKKLQESGALDNINEAIKGAVMTKLYMVAAGVVLVIVLLVFFGYKLYKSIKDKEIKREEKKKAKQLKKKK